MAVDVRLSDAPIGALLGVIPEVIISLSAVVVPEISAFPCTENVVEGVVVPIPTSPVFKIEKSVVVALAVEDAIAKSVRCDPVAPFGVAMVWSLPIVVENTPHWDNGQLEQVDNGVTGWVVKTVGGLSSAVHDLATNHTRRKEFGSAGRHKVIAEFAVECGVAQYELAYEQLHGKVGEAEVLKKMFPTPEAITAYHTAYTDRKALDFPHQASLLYEIYRWYVYGRFRILDSLVARGLWRLQK
jgi:hypothetical protein